MLFSDNLPTNAAEGPFTMNQAPSFEQLLAKSKQEMAQAVQRDDLDSLERLTRIVRECKEGQTQEQKLLQLKESLAAELDGGLKPESSGRRAAAPTTSIRPVPPSAKAKGKQERNAWLRKLANEGVRLRQVRGVRYETESRKRVGIA